MSQYSYIPSRADLERKYRRQNKNSFLHLLLFYILPFIIFNSIFFVLVTARPKISLEVADTNDYLTTQATISIQSWFPLKSITANLDGEELDLGKPKKRTYTVTITKNGLLETTVTNFNGMTIAQFEHINILDDNPPTIENAQVADGIVTLTVTDSQSGINAESIYATDSEGHQVMPLSVDHTTNTYSFTMDPAGLYVHAQDCAGNEVQGTFTSHKEGGTETLDAVMSNSEISEIID